MRTFSEHFPGRSLLLAAIGFLLGLLSNVIAQLLANQFILTAVVLLFLLLLVIYVVWSLRTPATVYVRFGHPTKVQAEDRAQYAREGLVAFVSMYRPVHRTEQVRLPPERWLAAAAELDYGALDLENSNLETTIQAIRTHEGRLKHCWLIGTAPSSPDHPGSVAYIPVLKEYLRRELGIDCCFHDGPAYDVSTKDDDQIYKKTYDLLQAIFEEARELQLDSARIVVDFTAGIRSMSLGAILASLDGKRDIQFVGAHYDAEGQIVPHELFTMIFNFDTVVPRT